MADCRLRLAGEWSGAEGGREKDKVAGAKDAAENECAGACEQSAGKPRTISMNGEKPSRRG